MTWKEAPTDIIKKLPIGQEFDICEEIKSPISSDHYDQETQDFESKLIISKKKWQEHLRKNSANYIR